MKITFLGSAAAEGIPLPYCRCRTCEHAREYGGKNVRKRCSYLINDDLLVDMGPDLFAACALHNVNLLNTKYMLVTHSHLDHFNVQNVKLRAEHFRPNKDLPEVTFVGGPTTMAALNQSGASDKRMALRRIPMNPYDHVELPDYKVKSVKATHFPSVGDAMNYMIDDGETKVLIASDTGIYEERVFQNLKNTKLDILIIEATKGDQPSNKVHMNIDDVLHVIQKMKAMGTVTEETVIYATHFAHQNCPPHEELSGMLERVGIHCVYDGLVIDDK